MKENRAHAHGVSLSQLFQGRPEALNRRHGVTTPRTDAAALGSPANVRACSALALGVGSLPGREPTRHHAAES